MLGVRLVTSDLKTDIFSYIVAQVLGAYVACLLIYAQYRDVIKVRHRK